MVSNNSHVRPLCEGILVSKDSCPFRMGIIILSYEVVHKEDASSKIIHQDQKGPLNNARLLHTKSHSLFWHADTYGHIVNSKITNFN